MTKRVSNILFAVCLACALVPFAAFADEPEVSTPAENEEVAVSAADPFAMVSNAIAPIISIDKEALFRLHYYWEAVENLDFETANEDGSLSEWQQGWYISHDWSDYGLAIASLEPGDAVTVNGETILILGRETWPTGSINWDIYDAIGWDKIVFQTCLGNTDIWIAYGIPVHPTPEFLASHE